MSSPKIVKLSITLSTTNIVFFHKQGRLMRVYDVFDSKTLPFSYLFLFNVTLKRTSDTVGRSVRLLC